MKNYFETKTEFEDLLLTDNYDFLRNKETFPAGLMYLCLGGSYAYNTFKRELKEGEKPSDVDFRGIAFNPKPNILFLKDYQKEQIVETKTDTTIYYFNKYAELLYSANPNIFELMGVPDEKIFLETPESKLLRKNIDIFLTKKVLYTFGRYGESQLQKIQDALNKDNISISDKEQRIFKSVIHTLEDTMNKASQKLKIGEEFKLYIDTSLREDMETEIFVDANFTKYPLRDFGSLLNSMTSVINRYGKLGKRNKKKDIVSLYKHCMQLIRLIIMCTEILSGKGIITSRNETTNLNLLLDIRNEKYSMIEIFQLYDDLIKKMNYAFDNSSLADNVDENKAVDLIMTINEMTLERYKQM